MTDKMAKRERLIKMLDQLNTLLSFISSICFCMGGSYMGWIINGSGIMA